MNQLEKIIRSIREDAYQDGRNDAGHPHSIDNDKRAIKKLIKELVAEAKPDYMPISKYAASIYSQGFNQAVDDFEQNLSKALEEK